MTNLFLFLIILTISLASAAVKNVLFIIVDDLRPASRVYNGSAYTRNLEHLAETGIVFNNAYAQIALCAPSRNSMLTSRNPDTTKLYDFYSYWRETAGNFSTLPQFLKNNGFDTYSIGKVFHEGVSSNFTDDCPYSWTSKPWHPPSYEFEESPLCGSNGSLHKNLVCPVTLEEQPGKTLPDIESTNEAIRFLDSRKTNQKPFFLAVGYHKPHIPFRFPKRYLDLYPLDSIELPLNRAKPDGLPEVAWNPWNDVRNRDDIKNLNVSYPFGPMPDNYAKLIIQAYLASVTYVDDLMGEILLALQRNDLFDNTAIVFLGDHGWSLGEHGEWAKFSNYDIALRVPLVMRIPNITSGTYNNDLIELIDIFPTVADILNLTPIPSCGRNSSNVNLCTEGASFWQQILGNNDFSKNATFSQYPRPGEKPTLHPNSDRPELAQISIMGYSVKTKYYRFTLWVGWRDFVPDWANIRGGELYDHRTDPQENHNLAGNATMEAVQKELKQLLIQHFSH